MPCRLLSSHGTNLLILGHTLHTHTCNTQLEWADTEIREIQHAIRNTEDTVEIQLDLLRNRILRFELVLNIVASVISFGCLVTGECVSE